jgi:UDP-N-acetylmuramoyl-L-alanyl-D-glutamate--2,6-diaminopimelate ligase
MKLAEILKGIEMEDIAGNADVDITGISYDSRKTGRGHLFVAMPGEHTDGHDYIEDAVKRGAAAVIHETGKIFNAAPGPSVTFIRVRDSREALSIASCNFHGNPSSKLTLIGITGPNGMTTTSYLLKSILESWDKRVGLIGTIQYMIGADAYEATHTTPESPEFQGLLDKMLSSGVSHVICEVSSHALAQHRVDGASFKAGIFTNFTRDHLDFHGTMENYFTIKESLFTELLASDGYSIINSDDLYGRRLIASLGRGDRENHRIYTYGLEEQADIAAADINNSSGGLRFKIRMYGRNHHVVSPLMGLPNVYNILSAAGASAALGVPWDIIVEGVRKAGTVRGRFERVDSGQNFLAIVDYAHTEDALERLIFTARGLTSGRIVTVFGCGGDRDRGKRPVMGSIATRLSDFVVLTSDNPRSEDPDAIISEIASGAERKNYLIEPDRAEAIRRAVLMAGCNDVILIAGKGHENYQEIKGKRLPFNDREVLERAIKQLTASQ